MDGEEGRGGSILQLFPAKDATPGRSRSGWAEGEQVAQFLQDPFSPPIWRKPCLLEIKTCCHHRG